MKDKTQVKVVKKERGRYHLKFPFLDVPVQTDEGFLQSIKKSDEYELIESSRS